MKPTVGRIVHAFGYMEHLLRLKGDFGPQAGIITSVDADGLVNLSLFRDNGTVIGLTRVPQRHSDIQGCVTWDWPAREGA